MSAIAWSLVWLPVKKPLKVTLTEEIVRQVSLQRPFAIVGAEVQRVTATNLRGVVADVPHGLIAGLVIVDRAPDTDEPCPHAAQAMPGKDRWSSSKFVKTPVNWSAATSAGSPVVPCWLAVAPT